MNSIGKLRLVVRWVAAGLVFLAAGVRADTYYVSRTGGSGTGSIDDPWSLEHANENAAPGDVVYLGGGTYTGGSKLNSSICPSRSGREGKPITFSACNNEPVILQDNPGFPSGVFLKKKSYVKVHGITVRRTERMLTILEGSHNEISHCTFDEYLTHPKGYPLKARIAQNSTYNWIHDCVFSRSGAIGPDPVFDDMGGTMSVGLSNSGLGSRPEDDSSHNLIERNTFYYGGHHLLELCTSFNVVRNNYFHNEGWMKCPPGLKRPGGLAGNRSMSTYYPAGRNLFENNAIAHAGVPPDNNMANGLEASTSLNIIRRNRFYHNGGAGLALYQKSRQTGADRNYIYSNTFYHNGYNHVRTGEYGGIWLVRSVKNVIKNNIFHDNKGPAIRYQHSPEVEQVVFGNWEEAGDPLFVNPKGDDPFNSDLPDLRLQAASPCIDKGEWLTTISSPSGSGKSFTVEDASYFMDGWRIVDGDLIQLEDQPEATRIAAIDYETDVVTVDRSLTWVNGQGVSLTYTGLRPDIGANEYRR